jgi:hypothetical protein
VAAVRRPTVRRVDPMNPATRRETEIQAALRMAIGKARFAPSLRSSQPWVWRITGEAAELSTEAGLSAPGSDPSERDTMLGCGASLHHARTALAAAGWRTHIAFLPDASRPGVLARIDLTGTQNPSRAVIAMAGAISRRRIDRGPARVDALPVRTAEALRSAVEQEGCRLSVVTSQVRRYDVAAPPSRTAPADPGSARGQVVAGQVAPGQVTAGPAGGDDRPAWAILYSAADSRVDELRAGQAMSALMLTATDLGVALSIQSQPGDVAAARAGGGGHQPDGLGYQQFVVHLGRRAAHS